MNSFIIRLRTDNVRPTWVDAENNPLSPLFPEFARGMNAMLKIGLFQPNATAMMTKAQIDAAFTAFKFCLSDTFDTTQTPPVEAAPEDITVDSDGYISIPLDMTGEALAAKIGVADSVTLSAELDAYPPESATPSLVIQLDRAVIRNRRMENIGQASPGEPEPGPDDPGQDPEPPAGNTTITVSGFSSERLAMLNGTYALSSVKTGYNGTPVFSDGSGHSFGQIRDDDNVVAWVIDDDSSIPQGGDTTSTYMSFKIWNRSTDATPPTTGWSESFSMTFGA